MDPAATAGKHLEPTIRAGKLMESAVRAGKDGTCSRGGET